MKKVFPHSAAVILSTLLVASPALANESPGGLKFALTGGLTLGGDDLFKVQFADGDSDKIKAGEILQVGAGALYQSPTMPLAAQITISYHFDTIFADNGDAGFDRYPLEGILYYTGVQDWRFGAGARLALSPEADASAAGDEVTVEFKNGTGFIVEVGYQVANNFWMNLRAVQEEYEVKRFNVNGMDLALSDDRDVSGNHVGLNFLWAF